MIPPPPQWTGTVSIHFVFQHCNNTTGVPATSQLLQFPAAHPEMFPSAPAATKSPPSRSGNRSIPTDHPAIVFRETVAMVGVRPPRRQFDVKASVAPDDRGDVCFATSAAADQRLRRLPKTNPTMPASRQTEGSGITAMPGLPTSPFSESQLIPSPTAERRHCAARLSP